MEEYPASGVEQVSGLSDLPAESVGPADAHYSESSGSDQETKPTRPLQGVPALQRGPQAQPASFQAFAGTSGTVVEPGNIGLLMDVSLPLSVRLGTARMTVRDILAIGPGSVIELDRAAGEPVDLFVNEKLIARGEVVVIDDNFGIRIVEITTGSDESAR